MFSGWNVCRSEVRETCSCGASFTATGPLATMAAYDWRTTHKCKRT